MMNTKAIILQCRADSKFHSGKIRVDTTNMLEDTSEILHSDTLFSALVNLAAKVMPNQVEDLIAAFRAHEIKVSSIFYCLENKGKYIYFLPKPLNFNVVQSGADRKSVKKINFISKGVWEQKTEATHWFDESKCTVLQNKFVCLNEELLDLGIKQEQGKYIEIFHTSATPKVHVHKEISDKENRYYTQANIHIADNESIVQVHLYFLVNENLNAALKNRLNTLFALLPHEGVGGDRTSGSGIFEDTCEQPFSIRNQDGKAVSLSLTVPADDAEFAAFESYEFCIRGGRQTHQDGTLKRVRMIAEGAVLNSADVHGTIVDISSSSNAPYLRNGKCLTLIY